MYLVHKLRLGTHGSRGSVSLCNAFKTLVLGNSAGRARKAVGSKAERWNQWVAFAEKCRRIFSITTCMPLHF